MVVIAAMGAGRQDELVSDRHVVFVIVPGFQSLDLAGPYGVSARGAQAPACLGRGDGGRLRLTVAAPTAGPVESESGLQAVADVAIDSVRGPIDTLVVAGGNGVQVARQDPAIVGSIARLAAR